MKLQEDGNALEIYSEKKLKNKTVWKMVCTFLKQSGYT